MLDKKMTKEYDFGPVFSKFGVRGKIKRLAQSLS
jgi:hypothetical protein